MILRNLDGILEQRGINDQEFAEMMGYNILTALTLRAGVQCSVSIGNQVADRLDVPIEDLTGEEPEVVFMPKDEDDLKGRIEFLENFTYQLTREVRKLTDILRWERGI